MPQPVDARIVLRAAGVSVVLDVTAGRLPAILHWGADLGDLSAADAAALAAASVSPVAPNAMDDPVRLSLVPEEWTGWKGSPGLSGSRDGRDWSPAFTTTALLLDGEPLTGDARTAAPAFAVRDTGGRVQITATDPTAQLELTIEVELDRSGIVRARAGVRNTGADPYQVDELLIALPVPQTAGEVLDFAGRWGKERTPQRAPIGVGLHRRESRRGKTGADSSYLLHAGAPGFGFAHGELWALHTAWSGNHVHQFERLSSGEQVLAGGELLLPGEVRLAEGEAYRGPWIYGAYGVGLDDVARRFHRMLRGRAQHPSSPRPVTLNVWEAVYFDHDLEVLTELADLAAEMGVERFVLDDGWFGSRRNDRSGLGDWVVSSDAWPDGLGPLVDHVRARGMQFGLWFEPEMVNPDSDIARAHPEWILQAGGRAGVESRHQLVLDLSDPDCYAHLRDAMCAILDAYDISYVKWDHNRDLVSAGTGADRRPGVHAQTLAFYRLVDELKERYPRLEIESCASGGGRVDLGVLERTDRIWVSDNIDPLDRQQMNRWTTQLVPPELMGCHVASGASHTTGRVHGLGFRASAAVFGHLGIEWDLRAASDDERALLIEWVAFYKAHRGMLHSGDLVRLDHPDPAVHVHGVVAADGSEALYSSTALARSELVTPGRLRLPGLDAQRRYRVTPVLIGGMPPGTLAPDWWTDGVVLPGSVLGGAGLAAPLLRPEQSILYRVEALTS